MINQIIDSIYFEQILKNKKLQSENRINSYQNVKCCLDKLNKNNCSEFLELDDAIVDLELVVEREAFRVGFISAIKMINELKGISEVNND